MPPPLNLTRQAARNSVRKGTRWEHPGNSQNPREKQYSFVAVLMFGLGISQATVCGRYSSDAVPICLVLWEPHKVCGTSIINEVYYMSLVHVTYSSWYNWLFTKSGRRPRMVSSQAAMTRKLRKSQRLSMKVGLAITLRLIFLEKKKKPEVEADWDISNLRWVAGCKVCTVHIFAIQLLHTDTIWQYLVGLRQMEVRCWECYYINYAKL